MAVTRAFLPKMQERGAGRIVNISSVGGRFTFPLGGAYNATKYAVEALSDAFRTELAMFGIKVVLVEPGPIKSEFAHRAVEGINALDGIAGSPWETLLVTAAAQEARVDKMSAEPIVVSRAVEKAIVRRWPRARYTVPFTASVFLSFLRFIPTRLVDAVMIRMLGMVRRAGAPRLAATTGATAS